MQILRRRIGGQPETPQVKCPRRLGTSIIIQLTC